MKGYKHLTASQIDSVLESYKQTLSIATVASLHPGISSQQVRGCVKRASLRLTGARGGACYRHIDSVRQWAAEGVSVSEIGRRIGTTSSKVSKFLIANQIYRKRFHQAMENNPAWRGGRVIDKDGYVLVKSPYHPRRDRHGYVREHRLVMEQRLGRWLLATEVVHHIDGNTQNNDPGNLELFDSNGKHLADTLTGVPKNISPEGRQRMRESTIRMNIQRRIANQKESSAGDSASQDTNGPNAS